VVLVDLRRVEQHPNGSGTVIGRCLTDPVDPLERGGQPALAALALHPLDPMINVFTLNSSYDLIRRTGAVLTR
jgi:hypothetical protein